MTQGVGPDVPAIARRNLQDAASRPAVRDPLSISAVFTLRLCIFATLRLIPTPSFRFRFFVPSV
jgi:hypothetical protein